MVSKNKLREWAVGTAMALTVLVSGYQVLSTNTWLDKKTAKYVWCGDSLEEGVNTKVTDLSKWNSSRIDDGKLDKMFDDMRPGDELKYGPLSITATDSRPQKRNYSPNARGDWVDEGVLSLGCPGYIEVDVSYDGEPVGKGSAEMAYASKFGLFKELPNFRLSDVLREAGLDEQERSELLSKARVQIQAERQERFTEKLEGILSQTPPESYNSEVSQRCRAEFEQVGESVEMRTEEGMKYQIPEGVFEYVVRRGDNKIRIANRIDACSDAGAFWPLNVYTGGDPAVVCKEEGKTICPYEDSNLKVNQKVMVNTGGWIPLPSKESYF